MNLVILTEKEALGDNRYLLKDNRYVHIRDILKLKVGDRFEIGILNGSHGQAEIENLSDDSLTLKCLELEPVADIKPSITVICALPRPQTMKKVLLTSAMMGVRAIHFIRANRVEKSYYQSPLLEPENYGPFLIEGLSQGKLTRLPEVTIHKRFKPFFEDSFPVLDKKDVVKLLPDPEVNKSLNKMYEVSVRELILAIGPEGGWVPFEIEMMESKGFRRFKLSRFILRVEHALTASLAQIELMRSAYDKK